MQQHDCTSIAFIRRGQVANLIDVTTLGSLNHSREKRHLSPLTPCIGFIKDIVSNVSGFIVSYTVLLLSEGKHATLYWYIHHDWAEHSRRPDAYWATEDWRRRSEEHVIRICTDCASARGEKKKTNLKKQSSITGFSLRLIIWLHYMFPSPCSLQM
jgi:hypothetical protein